MNRHYKRKILYAPLFAGMLLVGANTAFSAGTKIDYMNKINELEARISSLESLKKELQELKNNLAKKAASVTVKEKKLSKAIKHLTKVVSVREAKPDTIWHLAGFADTGFEAVSGGKNDSFVSGTFNPVFHFQYKDWLMIESELEIQTDETGATTLALEYSQLDFLLNDNMTFVTGKYLSPIGQFKERLHPSWINRTADMPAGFGHGGVQPSSEVGFMLRGGVPVNDSFTFTYAVSVGNGPRFGHAADELELEGTGKDNNGNKAFGGRLALLHISSLEVGLSYMNAGLSSKGGLMPDGDIEPAKQGDYRLWGADIGYSKGPWDIRAEYLNAKNSPKGGAVAGGFNKTTWEAWYAQAAYRLFGLSDNPILGKIEPVIRYGEFRVKIIDAFQLASEKRLNFGVNYWLAPTIVVKAGIERRNYFLASQADETRYKLQFAYGF